MTAHRQRVLAWVLGVSFVALGFWRVESTVNRLDDNRLDDAARQCVDDWEASDSDRATWLGIIAMLERAFPEAGDRLDPIRREAAVQADLVPDPSCDLAAARERLDI